MMAFHVACPITCERICYCPLGFGKKIQSEKAKKSFLDDVFKAEQFLKDPWSVKLNQDSQTVQVLVPKVVAPPPAPPLPQTPAQTVVVVNKEVVESGGGDVVGGDVGEREEKEMLSLQAKRIALQKQAFEASLAAEEYVRKIESGVLLDDSGEALPDHFREDQGMKVMCRICFDGENEGSEKATRMLACKLCNKKYHRSCLKSWGLHRDLFHLSSWVCSSCRTCEVCRRTGNPTKFMFCKRCDGAHHCYCLQHAQKNVSIGPYLCPKHTKCHSCASNVSGNGPSTKWFLGYTFCDACGRLFVKGNYCPVCLKVYRDTEPTPMVCCDVCQRWVHCQCDGISDDKYLQFQADGNLYYKCAACRGECYKVTGPEDAVQEVWRRRDKADRDLIASLRDAAGLPSEEAFSVSIYSDDEDYNPTISKNDPGGSLKFSVKGSGLKGTKNTKQYGKKSSKKMYGKKKGYQVSLIGAEDAHHSFDGHDQRSIEFNLSDEKQDDMTLYRSEGMDMLSSPTARSPGNTKEKCSINQAGFMKHDFVEEVPANNGKRVPKVAQTKSGKSHGSGGFGYEKQENTKGKKLVIHIGARNKNVINSPRSEASSCHREQDITASNGSEDTSHIKVKKKYGVERNDGAARMYDGEGGKSESKETLKYSRAREGSLLKLGKVKPEVSELNSQSKEGRVAAPESVKGAPTLRTEEVPLRRHSKGRSEMHSETQNTNTQASGLDSLPKDPKPLLKLKFKNSNLDKDRKSPVPQEEEKSSVKGQRSKRKRPSEKNEVREEESNTQLHQDNPVSEVMDANWVLKKLGKDAIGKRVEVHHPSDGSWHKGVVTDVIEGTSTLSVRLDEGGRDRKLELGKQAIRFISQKQKRTKAIML